MRNQHETSDGCTNPNANGNGANTNTKTTLDIDYSLPLTTTIKRMKNAGYIYNLMGDSLIAPNSSIDGQVDEVILMTGLKQNSQSKTKYKIAFNVFPFILLFLFYLFSEL